MASKAEMSIVSSDSLKDQFTFDKQRQYLPVVKEVALSNNNLTFSFPPHSFTQIKIAVKK
jgi:alpha-N-arabinofuranosidase